MIGKKLMYEQEVASLDYALYKVWADFVTLSLWNISFDSLDHGGVIVCLVFHGNLHEFPQSFDRPVWKLRLLAAPFVASTGSLRLTY